METVWLTAIEQPSAKNWDNPFCSGLAFAGCKRIKLLVQPERIHISIELPRDPYRRLHETAAKHGCTAQQLMLRSIEPGVDATPRPRPKQRLSLDEPLVPPTGKPVSPTEEQIYGVGFP